MDGVLFMVLLSQFVLYPCQPFTHVVDFLQFSFESGEFALDVVNPSGNLFNLAVIIPLRNASKFHFQKGLDVVGGMVDDLGFDLGDLSLNNGLNVVFEVLGFFGEPVDVEGEEFIFIEGALFEFEFGEDMFFLLPDDVDCPDGDFPLLQCYLIVSLVWQALEDVLHWG